MIRLGHGLAVLRCVDGAGQQGRLGQNDDAGDREFGRSGRRAGVDDLLAGDGDQARRDRLGAGAVDQRLSADDEVDVLLCTRMMRPVRDLPGHLP